MRDKILRMELYGKFEDESLIKEVLASFPVRVEITLNYYRNKTPREGPRRQRPTIRLPYCQLKMEVTRWSVVTLGSNDLPTDWKDYNFSDLFSQEETSILITTEQVLIVLSISGT